MKFRGAESIWPSGAKLLGICSNVKAVGTILLESWITRYPSKPRNDQHWPGTIPGWMTTLGLLGSLHNEKPQIERRGRCELNVSVHLVLRTTPPVMHTIILIWKMYTEQYSLPVFPFLLAYRRLTYRQVQERNRLNQFYLNRKDPVQNGLTVLLRPC